MRTPLDAMRIIRIDTAFPGAPGSERVSGSRALSGGFCVVSSPAPSENRPW
jgi:hypothetical protein